MILYKTFHFFFPAPFSVFSTRDPRNYYAVASYSVSLGAFSAPRSSKVVIIAPNRFCFRLLRLTTRQIYCNEKALSGTRSIVSAGQRERCDRKGARRQRREAKMFLISDEA